jgi:sugar phosphate isomerase/epimerase
MYEITFVGRADAVARAEFDDCEISAGPDTTTLHRELPDQGALYGLIQRVADLGLELIGISVVAPPADLRQETRKGPAR